MHYHCGTKEYFHEIYLRELEIKETTEGDGSISHSTRLHFLDVISNLNASLYDKQNDCICHITNFPFLSNNIPCSPTYCIVVSRHKMNARQC